MPKDFFSESELILNKRGGIYHLDLLPDEIANDIIVVGDQDRVNLIQDRFDAVFNTSQHREFASFTGRIGNKTLTVLSTGIGTDNIDIVWNELDALANIDFENRCTKPTHTKLNVFRLGTCGTIIPEINPGELILSTHSIGLDNLYWFYENKPTHLTQFHEQLATYANQIGLPVKPYVTAASDYFTTLFSNNPHQGYTLTAPGFYAPQGRSLRLKSIPANGAMAWSNFNFKNQNIVNFEMETSALFSLGKQLGHNVGALCVALANRANQTFHKQPEVVISRLLDEALSVLTKDSL
jgi:uridine phosphorylase